MMINSPHWFHGSVEIFCNVSGTEVSQFMTGETETKVIVLALCYNYAYRGNQHYPSATEISRISQERFTQNMF